MSKNRAVLVISGYNTRAIIAFCRWAVKHQTDFYVVARDPNDPIFLTEYGKHVVITRKNPQLICDDLISWKNLIYKTHGHEEIIVLPSSEYINRFLLANREILFESGCITPLPDAEIYIEISNKYSFTQLCQSHNIAVPDEFPTPPTPPFVAKPKRYISNDGKQLIPLLILSNHDLDKLWKSNNPDDYFIQEFAEGNSIYLLAYLKRDGGEILYSQENLIQQPKGGSIILSRRSLFHTSPTAKNYVSMLRKIGFHGIIMIEVRLNKQSGRCLMIEANPRLWGPIQFTVDNDVGIFESMLLDYDVNFCNISQSKTDTDFYFWSGGLMGTNNNIAFHNYTSKQFLLDLPYLKKHDIYLRQDTINLYLNESQAQPCEH